VKVKRIITKRIRHSSEGLQIAADVNAALHVNVDERPDRAGEPAPEAERKDANPAADRDDSS
jgi:hypothetical protein